MKSSFGAKYIFADMFPSECNLFIAIANIISKIKGRLKFTGVRVSSSRGDG